jgi:hypothetical protein
MRSIVLVARPRAGAPPSSRPGRDTGPARRWRRRRTKGQVAAVATIFGLMIVVTVIANYISTTLPGQMSANDLSHTLLVENQVGRLGALLQAIASPSSVGLEASQPISLGSAAAPPFAPPDGAVAGPLDPYSSLSVAFRLVGPPVYSPPGGGVPNSGHLGTGCAFSNTSKSDNFACSSGGTAAWNFSSATVHSYNGTWTGAGGAILNYSASSSILRFSGTGGALTGYLVVIGSHDNVYLNTTAGLTATVVVFGSFDNVSLSTSVSATVHLTVVGDNDHVAESHTGTLTVNAAIAGTTDSFAASTATGAGTVDSVYFTAYDPNARTSAYCPYDNLTSTDSVSGGITGGTYTVSFNNTAYAASRTIGTYWTATWRLQAATTDCPFYVTPAQSFAATWRSGIDVHLLNTYSPTGEVALDDGMVVFAQPGGTPIMLDAPPITTAGTGATVLLTSFLGSFASEAGVGTAELTARLVAFQTLSLATSGMTLAPGSDLNITVQSPFAAAWVNYFETNTAFTGTVACAGPSEACVGPYTTGGPNGEGLIGTVSLVIPATTLTVQLATYAPALS